MASNIPQPMAASALLSSEKNQFFENFMSETKSMKIWIMRSTRYMEVGVGGVFEHFHKNHVFQTKSTRKNIWNFKFV